MRRWIINNKIEEEDAKLMISFFSEIKKELNRLEHIWSCKFYADIKNVMKKDQREEVG